MTKEKKIIGNINIFDSLTALIIVFMVIIFVVPSYINKESTMKDMVVTLSIKNNVDIYPDNPSDLGVSYFNSVNKEITVLGLEETIRDDKKTLDILILGKGDISGKVYIFNGQRILIGQTGELRSNYFAQGIITDIRYEDN